MSNFGQFMSQKIRFLLFFLFGLISTHWTQEDACHTEDKKFRKIVSEAIAANDFNSQTSQFGDLIRKYPN